MPRGFVAIILASRVLVFAVAALSFSLFGEHATNPARYDASGIGSPLGGAAEALAGVWSRWDSVWFLGIVESGYEPAESEPAFFPLYPLLVWSLGGFAGPEAAVVAGVAVSLGALVGAGVLLGRLAALETDAATARLAVLLLALFPGSWALSAVYSESLFLLVTVGAVWFARTDRWALAGLFGAAAAATRSAGILVLVPLVLIYLLGPRGTEKRTPPTLGAPAGRAEGRRRHPVRRDFAWLALVPAGLAAYAAHLWARTGDPLRFVTAQEAWGRSFADVAGVPMGPVAGLGEGLAAGIDSAASILGGSEDLVLWRLEGGPVFAASQNLEYAAVLVAAIAATVWCLRLLPLAYGAYAVCALALPLTFTAEPVPLLSMTRLVGVVFPLFIAAAVRLRGTRALPWVVAASALLLAWQVARFATWQWVA